VVTCRSTGYQLMSGDITRDGGAGGDHGVLAECHTTNDRGIGSDGCSVLHVGFHDLPVRVERSRHEIVGERGRRTDEHIVADAHSVVHADVVLQLATISDNRVDVSVNVLADNAFLPDPGTVADTGVMPNTASRTDVGTIFDSGGGCTPAPWCDLA